MIYNGNYSDQELIIFENVRKHFETLPPIANDYYANAFYDLVAQFGGGGEEYMDAGTLFSDLIEVQIEFAYEKLSEDEKKVIKEFYENNFIDDQYYDSESDECFYDISDLSILIVDRFKAWIYDTFDECYFEEELIDENYLEKELDEEEDDELIIMPSTKTPLKEVFDLFVSTDHKQPELKTPFVSKGYVVASNGYILIRVRKEHCNFEIDGKNNGPDMTNVIPKNNRQNIVKFKDKFFETYKTIDEFENVVNEIECPTCEGDCLVEWSFKTWIKYFACPHCSGRGAIQEKIEKKTGKKLFDSQKIKIEDTYLRIEDLYKLNKVRSLMGGSNIELVSLNSGDNSGVMFKIGICEVLIMPLKQLPSEDIEVIDITHKVK